MSQSELSVFDGPPNHGAAGAGFFLGCSDAQWGRAHSSIAPQLCRYIKRVEASDGAAIQVYELDGDEDAPAIVFGHACGFAAGSYLSLLSALAGLRIFAFDVRGHGASSAPDDVSPESLSLARMAADLALVGQIVADRTGHRPHYLGHSMSGASALWLLAFGDASAFSGFTLFEPAVFPQIGHATHAEAVDKHRGLISLCERRRWQWESREEYASRLSKRGPFAQWSPTMIRDHVSATTRYATDGRIELCCPPSIETAILQGLMNSVIWDALPSIERRVHLISADPLREDRAWMTTCMSAMARQLPNASLDTLPGTHHLSMFSHLDKCRALVEDHCTYRDMPRKWLFVRQIVSSSERHLALPNVSSSHDPEGSERTN